MNVVYCYIPRSSKNTIVAGYSAVFSYSQRNRVSLRFTFYPISTNTEGGDNTRNRVKLVSIKSAAISDKQGDR